MSHSGRAQELPGEHQPDITLLSTSINETQRRGTEVANLQAIDEDPTTRYSLVNGIASVDNDKFKVIGDKLIAKESINYQKQNDYFIRIRSADADGDVREEAIQLSVNKPTASDGITGLQDINGNTSWTPYDKSSVNIINNTQSPFILWEDVTDNRRLIQPGQQQRISNFREGVSENQRLRDITTKFYLPKSIASSTYIGTLWFTNNANHGFDAAARMGSDMKSFFTTNYERGAKEQWAWIAPRSSSNNKTWRPVREEALSSFSIDPKWGQAYSSDPNPWQEDIAFTSFLLW